MQQQLRSGVKLEDVEVDLKLTVIKPLHAQWLVNMYNYFTGPECKKVILEGWKKAGISGLFDSTTRIQEEDPFCSIFD